MLLAASVCIARTATAGPTWSGTAGSLTLGGSARTIPAFLDGSPAGLPGFAFGETRLRGTLQVSSPERTLLFEAHLLGDLLLSEEPGAGPLANGSPEPLSLRAVRLGWTVERRPGAVSTVSFDRLSLRLRLPRADLTVGRQPVNFSKAWFWNPLDVFLPFDPRSFDRDFKPGVDGVRLQVPLGAVSGVDAVAAAGPRVGVDPLSGSQTRDPTRGLAVSGEGSAAVVRAFTDLAHTDVSLQAGKVPGGDQLGAGFSGELFGIGLRGEGAWFHATDAARVTVVDAQGAPLEARLFVDHAAVVVGADHRFESGLYLAGEAFYDGAGEDRNTAAGYARVLAGAAPDASRGLVGLLVQHDLTPLVGLSLSGIASSDGSAVAIPSVQLSLSPDGDLVLGAIAGTGRRARTLAPGIAYPRSEFGSAPGAGWAELKLYW